MQDLIPRLAPSPIDKPVATTTSTDDLLGSTLTAKWTQWSTVKRYIEEMWLEDLRAFSQQNEPDAQQLSKFHSHIFIGLIRTKCNAAYSRISDLMFQSRELHWGIEPTPIPEDQANDPVNESFIDKMQTRSDAMETEIEDQMIDLHYEDYLKQAILEACIIGTGCIKGIIPGIKVLEKWAFSADEVTGAREWDIVKSEIPFPQMSAPSVFDIYPDPYANRNEDMSGCYERHVLNRNQFSELKGDPRFDSVKINEILEQTDRGNHAPLWHETIRRNIAKVTDSTASQAERYDVLEYWGQVAGRLLQNAGVKDVKESDTYWANVWTCSGKTLLAKVMPMKKQRIPYNFFHYNKIPHQFWGVGPARMGRSSQLGVNGVVRSILDGMAMVAMPMSEVNVTMLKDGQDPNIMLPGMTWLRDSGDPSVPAVRFFQPTVPTGQLIQMGEMFKSYADDETSLPAYTYGDQGNEVNQTAQGMSMQMGAASLPIKSVVKNLEDGMIKPFIESLYDWNMQWSDKENIKGDMQVQVLVTSALMAKEQKSQQLMQFLNLAESTPLAQKYVDFKYLLTQIAKSMEIDTKKAIPDKMPENEQPQPEQPTAVDQAKIALTQAQIKLVDAQVANTNMKTQFESVTTAISAINAGEQSLVVGDELLASAGFPDANGAPMAQVQPQQPMPQQVAPENTHPGYPPNIQEPQFNNPAMEQQSMPSPAMGEGQGIEGGV